MIHVPRLEYNITLQCNFGCGHCTHFSNHLNETFPKEEIIRSFRDWSGVLRPGQIRIIGGEPLLHSDCEEIISEAVSIWKNSKIALITNGFLFLSMPERFFTLLKEKHIEIEISTHFIHDAYVNKMVEILTMLAEKEINYQVVNSIHNWYKIHAGDAHTPKPYISNPQHAWNTCVHKNNCLTIHENKLYRCPVIPFALLASRKGKAAGEYADILSKYIPLEHTCTEEEMRQFLHLQEIPQCAICPETFDFISIEEKFHTRQGGKYL